MIDLERGRLDSALARCDALIEIGDRIREGSEAPFARALEKAAEEGLRALNLEPEHPLPYTNVGRAYLNLYRLDDAKTIYEKKLTRSQLTPPGK